MTTDCPDRECHEMVRSMAKDVEDIHKDMYKRPGGLVFCIKDKVSQKLFWPGLCAFLAALLFVGNQLYAPKEVKFKQDRVLEILEEQRVATKDIQRTVNKLSQNQDKEASGNGGMWP